jgi:ABC-type nickel/cobalt efflux system permease component RcnA
MKSADLVITAPLASVIVSLMVVGLVSHTPIPMAQSKASLRSCSQSLLRSVAVFRIVVELSPDHRACNAIHFSAQHGARRPGVVE